MNFEIRFSYDQFLINFEVSNQSWQKVDLQNYEPIFFWKVLFRFVSLYYLLACLFFSTCSYNLYFMKSRGGLGGCKPNLAVEHHKSREKVNIYVWWRQRDPITFKPATTFKLGGLLILHTTSKSCRNSSFVLLLTSVSHAVFMVWIKEVQNHSRFVPITLISKIARGKQLGTCYWVWNY